MKKKFIVKHLTIFGYMVTGYCYLKDFLNLYIQPLESLTIDADIIMDCESFFGII
jgi:hypothetical protein